MSTRFDGRTYQVGLRAKLAEAAMYAEDCVEQLNLMEAAEEQEAVRGRCRHLCCRRRYEEVLQLRDAAPRRASKSGGRSSTESALAAQVQAQQVRMQELEREVAHVNQRRAYDRKMAKQAAALATSKGKALETAKQQLLAREEELTKVTQANVQLTERTQHQKERLRTVQKLSKELEQECTHATAALQAAEEAGELATETSEASIVELQKKVDHLSRRSEVLRRINISRSRTGQRRGEQEPEPLPESSTHAGMDPRELLEQRPKVLSPTSKQRRRRLVVNAGRRLLDESEEVSEVIGESRSPLAISIALNKLDLLNEVWDTPLVWALRIKDAQELVKKINGAWDANLAARIKNDYLLSNRDLDALRCDWSFDIINGRPVPRILLSNPYCPQDISQHVKFPEPITQRTGGWQKIVDAQAEYFGITINEDHEDMSKRKFAANLQRLVTRDEALLESPETFGPDRPLIAVIGFDGFMDCCHVYLRLIDYKKGVAKESEMKGTGLCVASGDDHNQNLSRIFQNLGPEP